MSIRDIEKAVIDEILGTANTKTKKTLGRAARKIVQSEIPTNYLILDIGVNQFLYDTFKKLSEKSINQQTFIASLHSALIERGWVITEPKSAGLRAFINRKLEGAVIYKLPGATFRTFRDSLNAVLNDINGTEDKKFLDQTVNLDHAGQGTFSSSAAAGSLILAKVLQGASEEDKKDFPEAVADTAFDALRALKRDSAAKYKKLVDAYGGIQSLKALIRKVLIKWRTVVTEDGKEASAALELILTPDSALGQQATSAQERALLYDIIIPSIEKQIDVFQQRKGLQNLKGSPSLVDRVGASLIDKIKPRVRFKNGKVVIRISANYSKPSYGSKNTKTQKVYKKPESKENFNTKIPSVKPRVRAKATTGATLPTISAFIGILNSRLPDTVSKNMGSPRLNYRTGRFANSTRVVDIQSTSKGYPSVQYTYMRYPYEVFEFPGTGSPLAQQGQRDPRSLIDKSIREIMAEYAVGRFYTRRV